MKQCEHFQEMISMYIDNMLTDDEKAQFDVHSASCPECREELHVMEQILGACAGMEEELPENFIQQLHEKLVAASEPREEERKTKKSYNVIIKTVSTIAACAIIIVTLGIFAIYFMGGNQKSSQSSNLAGAAGATEASDAEADSAPIAEMKAARLLPEPDNGGQITADKAEEPKLTMRFNEDIEESVQDEGDDGASYSVAVKSEEQFDGDYSIVNSVVNLKVQDVSKALNDIANLYETYGISGEDSMLEKMAKTSRVATPETPIQLEIILPEDKADDFLNYLAANYDNIEIMPETNQVEDLNVPGKVIINITKMEETNESK